jgi:hypothetical protein
MEKKSIDTNKVEKKAESIYRQTNDTQKTGNYRATYPLNPDAVVSSYLLKASKDEALKLSTENAVGSGLVNCMVDGMIGSGLSLESVVSSNILKTSKKKIAKNSQLIEEYWNLWAKTAEACDVLGENTFGSMTRVAGFNAFATGDVLQFIGIHKWHGIYVPYVRYYDGRSVMNKDDAANSKKSDTPSRVRKHPTSTITRMWAGSPSILEATSAVSSTTSSSQARCNPTSVVDAPWCSLP